MTQTESSLSSALGRALNRPAPWIVGVVNTTPDSFSDGGSFIEERDAISHAGRLLDDGADIIEFGAESTAPGSSPIGAEEEFQRLRGPVAALAPRAFVAIDTYKAETARHCLELGARMINDVSALRADPAMAATIRDFNAFVVMMHSKEPGESPHASDTPRDYTDIFREIVEFLRGRVEYAVREGIPAQRIVLDPGMGRFLSNDSAWSWKLLAEFDRLKSCGIASPLLIGTSRKGFLGGPLKDRDPASQLTSLIAVLKGAQVIRTHNVKMMREFLEIWQRCAMPLGDLR